MLADAGRQRCASQAFRAGRHEAADHNGDERVEVGEGRVVRQPTPYVFSGGTINGGRTSGGRIGGGFLALLAMPSLFRLNFSSRLRSVAKGIVGRAQA